MRALDVGSGSGYLAAVMARMVGAEEKEGGKVIGIDYLSPLVELAVENVMKADADLLQSALAEEGKSETGCGLLQVGSAQACHA